MRLPDFEKPIDMNVTSWQALKSPNRELFAVGRNQERQAVVLVILDRFLQGEWVSGHGLDIANGIDDKLGKDKSVTTLSAGHVLVKDPEFIYAAIQTFTPGNHIPLGARYGELKWEKWSPEQLPKPK